MFSWRNKKLDDINPNKIRKNLVAYVVLGLALLAMTFFGVCTPGGGGRQGPAGQAGSVGEFAIRGADFRRAYTRKVEQLQSQYQENFDAAKLNVSSQVMNELVDQLVNVQIALDSGFYATEDEIIEEIVMSGYFNDDSGKFSEDYFKRGIRGAGFTEASYTETVLQQIVTSKMQQVLSTSYYSSKGERLLDKKIGQTKYDVSFVKIDPKNIKVSVSDDEAKAFLADEATKGEVGKYYDANKEEFNKPAQVKARHILIAFEGARNATSVKRNKDEALKMASKVLSEAKAKPGDFATVAERYTDDPSGKGKGGDLGFFERDTMVKEFSDVAFSLASGQISEVVESPFGFHIIKVEAIKEPVNKTLEQVEIEIAKKLIKEKKQPEELDNRAKDILALASSKDPGLEGKLKEYGLNWTSEKGVAADARSIPGIGADEKVMAALLSMQTDGQVFSDPLEVAGNRYVLRMDKKTQAPADLKLAEDDELNFGQYSPAFFEAMSLFRSIRDAQEESYRKNGLIKVESEYENYSLERASGVGT